MPMDFPAFPAVGQEYTVGTVTYVYNGTGWVVKGSTADQFVVKSGDTMTGHLGLIINPSANHAVRKDYVDSADAAIGTNIGLKADKTYVDTQDNLKVAKLGDTMTGDLLISGAKLHFVADNIGTNAPFSIFRGANLLAFAGGTSGYQWNNDANSISLATLNNSGTFTANGGFSTGGELQITALNPVVRLLKTTGAAGVSNYIVGSRTGAGNGARWSLVLGDGTAETGSGNVGSNFSINNYNDAGGAIATPLYITRSNGVVNIFTNVASTNNSTGALIVTGGVGVAGAVNAGSLGLSGDFTSAGTGYFNKTGAGSLNVNGTTQSTIHIGASAGPAILTLYSNNNAQALINHYNVGLLRWMNGMQTGPGNDYFIGRSNDAGTFLDTPIYIYRSNGQVRMDVSIASTNYTTGSLVVSGGVGIAGQLNCASTIQCPTLYVNSSGNPTINFVRSGTATTAIFDNGGGIIVASNAAMTTGMYIGNGQSVWTALSDARLPYKRSAREITDRMPPLDHFRLYEGENDSGAPEIFAMAQEMNGLFPQVVKQGSDDPDYIPSGINDLQAWGMSYDRLGAIALAYCKQLRREIAELKLQLKEK